MPVAAFYLFHLSLSPISTEQQKRPWYRASASAEENRKAREAYRVLMTVTLRKPDTPEYLAFTKEVQRRAKHDYNYTYVSNEVGEKPVA
ncbi:unnamed protein product [Dibothriocephalus latus]|uniref:Uncharacterized protein n=1 Tax=Dibothriocephalus latus TaxID=60516 RepID=A0A3P7MR75_DIBLA|nr:unnamed protein product [Dibothriocephalus latus]